MVRSSDNSAISCHCLAIGCTVSNHGKQPAWAAWLLVSRQGVLHWKSHLFTTEALCQWRLWWHFVIRETIPDFHEFRPIGYFGEKHDIKVAILGGKKEKKNWTNTLRWWHTSSIEIFCSYWSAWPQWALIGRNMFHLWTVEWIRKCHQILK